MSIYLWIILILISFISVAFMIRLHQIRQFKKYRYFRYYSYALVMWSMVTLLRSVVIEPFFIYQLSFLIFPIVFLVTSFLYMTIHVYNGGQISKNLKILTLVFFLVDLTLSLTNSLHHLLLQIDLTSAITSQMFSLVPLGTFFYIHTLACYLLMFIGLYELLKLFLINFKRDKDAYPFITFSVSIVIGIILNIIHVFFYPFVIDPTFIFMILVGIIMLNIFKNRDLRIILYTNGNKDILDNTREMYIISNHQGRVIDCSKNLKIKNKDLIESGVSLSELKEHIKQNAVLYLNEKELTGEFDSNKHYYHVKEQRIRMPHFLYYGSLTLLYDETSDVKLISEMDRIMSHDLMTGLYNRNFFENQIPLLENTNNNFGVIIIDVDGLKLHNDYLGHKAGDELLINFSNLMVQICQQKEELVPVRLGGDEFLIIAKHGDINKLNVLAEELTKKCFSDNPIININFSYGISVKNEINSKVSSVLRDADKNLYVMKEKKIEEKKKLEKYFRNLEK